MNKGKCNNSPIGAFKSGGTHSDLYLRAVTAPAIAAAEVNGISFRPLFFLLVILHLLYHALVFHFINSVYLDSDQAFMWAGLADYASGIFREPRFYGQDYNTFFEALVAVPFSWIGLPVYSSLPLATHICSFLPWLVPSIFLYRKGDVARATAFLAVPLCLLLPYDVVTGIPRGFVGGLTFTMFFAHSLYSPKHLGYATLNLLMAIIGYYINPNSLLVSGPCLFFIFLHNAGNLRYYLWSAACGMPMAVACWFVFDRFYYQNPQYIIYGMNLEFSLSHLVHNLRHIHERLAHVSFFSTSHAWFTGVAFLLLLTALFIHNRKGFLAALIAPLILLASFATNKAGDGSLWPFYSFSRSFIGLPLFFGFFLTLLPSRNQLSIALVTAALATGIYKLSAFNRSVAGYFDESKWLGVHLVKVEDALHAMRVYKKVCEEEKAEELMVSNNFWLNTVLSYGGRAVFPDFPVAFETNNERRYWLREGLAANRPHRFIYISSRNDLESVLQQRGFKLRRLDDYGLYLVHENSLTNAEFIRRSWTAESR